MTKEAREAWENIYQQGGYAFNEPFPRFQDLVKVFQQHGCKRILDLGCGGGRHVLALVKLGFQVVGVDASPTGLGLARKRHKDEGCASSFVLGDMTQTLPYQSECFDGLLSTQVIHHAMLNDIRRVIGEIHRVVKVGGIAFVTVPAKPEPEIEYDELSPGTLVPRTGDEAGVPHHYFSIEAFGREFYGFDHLELSVRGQVVIAFTGKKRKGSSREGHG
jgi:tellurite methyltransferase